MRYSNDELKSWTSPLSETEEARVENTEKMIRDAIYSDPNLNKMDIEVFAQGSYANNTNVKAESDIDICVMLKDTFHTKYPEGKKREDYKFVASNFDFADYKAMVKKAVENKFGYQNIAEGNKSIKIRENTYHVNADVVPCFQYRNYYYSDSLDPNIYVEGTWFISNDGHQVVNYPKRHKEKGVIKNDNTRNFYKRLVRIMKHIKNNMVDDGVTNGNVINSFLIECLVYNVPNEIIAEDASWNQTVYDLLVFIYKSITNNNHTYWCEVSGMLYLFVDRKWSSKDVANWVNDVILYLGY